MLDQANYNFCSEFYEVERAVEVVVEIAGEPRTIRIEAHRQGNSYCTRALVERDITVQPTYPQEHGEFVRKQESITVWATYDLPWTHGDTAEEAITQALRFLSERCSK